MADVGPRSLAEGAGVASAKAEYFVVLALAVASSCRCLNKIATNLGAGGMLPFQGYDRGGVPALTTYLLFAIKLELGS